MVLTFDSSSSTATQQSGSLATEDLLLSRRRSSSSSRRRPTSRSTARRLEARADGSTTQELRPIPPPTRGHPTALSGGAASGTMPTLTHLPRPCGGPGSSPDRHEGTSNKAALPRAQTRDIKCRALGCTSLRATGSDRLLLSGRLGRRDKLLTGFRAAGGRARFRGHQREAHTERQYDDR